MPTENRSSADKCRADSKPYLYAIAHFARREHDRDNQTITFHFGDDSAVTFKIMHKLQEAS